MDRSGLSIMYAPSKWFWKRTPSSVILRSLARDQTWNPPESVKIGRFQEENLCNPPICLIKAEPGRRDNDRYFPE